MPIPILSKWSFESPKFRRETVDQLYLVIEFVERYLDEHVQRDDSRRSSLETSARQAAFTWLLHNFLRDIPTRVDARKLWERAVEVAPRSHPAGSCPHLLVDREVGRRWFELFQFEMSGRKLRDHKDPHLTALGYLLEGLGRDQLQDHVRSALDASPALQEVIGCAAPSSPSPSSS